MRLTHEIAAIALRIWKEKRIGTVILCVCGKTNGALGLRDFQEDVLEDLAKGAGGFALANLVGKSRKFNGLDIKRVYFG